MMRKLLAALAHPIANATPPKKPARPRERTGGYWPDEDLEELENPRATPGWIPRRKGWLTRRK